MPVQTQLQIRRDTAANWSSTNPTLASGEWGLETDTRQYKIGDGVTAWNSLGYQLGPLLDEDIATDSNGAYFTGSGFRVFNAGGNFVTAPDSAALDITGDIDIRVKMAATDWTPSTGLMPLVSKYGAVGQRSYFFALNSSGTLQFGWTADGTTLLSANSSVATGVLDGATKWVRVTLDVNNGASGNDVIFYLSDDGTTWTQLGTTVTTAGTTSIFNSTAVLEISNRTGTTQPSGDGTFYRAQILNGIGGTVAFDANFETVPADSFAFTESSANAATVTLTTTRYSFGLPGAGFTGTGIGGGTQARLNYWPIKVSNKPITLKHYAFEVTTAPSGTATVRVGIYASDAMMQPIGSPLLNSSFTVTSTGTGAYRVRITPLTLKPGNYIIALYHSLGLQWRSYISTNTVNVRNTLSATPFIGLRWVSGTTMTDPATKWTNVDYIANPSNYYAIILGWS